MKLAAIVEDGLRSEEFYCDYVPAVLRKTGADGVMAIMSDPITHSNSALYSYVPSIRILSGEDTWVDFLKTNASVPVADSEEEMTETELSAKKLYSAVYA